MYSVVSMDFPSCRGQGRPKKTWSECVRADMILFDLFIDVKPLIFQICRDGSSWVEPVLNKD